MKKTLLTLAVFAIAQFVCAQTPNYLSKFTSSSVGNSLMYDSGTGIGIGTTNPGSTLDIQTSSGVGVSGATGLSRIITAVNDVGLSVGQSNVARHLDLFAYGMNQVGEDMYLNAISHNMILQSNGGRIGVGVTAPMYKLDIGGDLRFGSATSGLALYNYAFHNHLDAVGSDSNIGIDIQTQGAGSFTVNGNTLAVDGGISGNVGIGTTTPDAKLAVKGTIHAQEVKVDMSGWNDFVFEKTYPLPTLSALRKYIDQHHHLPEVPSEAEVIKNGVNLGDMVKLQTKKIEELTLYLLAKDQQVTAQQEQLAAQQKINQSLQRQINQLAKRVNK